MAATSTSPGLSVGTAGHLLTAAPFHLMSYSLLLGGTVGVSWNAKVAAANLDRKSFSKLQSHVFPTYFWAQTILSVVLMGTYRLGPTVITSIVSPATAIVDSTTYIWNAPWSTIVAIGLPVVTNLANAAFLGPRSKAIKQQIAIKELKQEAMTGGSAPPYTDATNPSPTDDASRAVGSSPTSPVPASTPEIAALKSRFGMLHGISMLFNFATLASISWYGVSELSSRM